MSRPAHIAPLDAALDQHMEQLRSAEAELPAVLDRNIREYDRIAAVIDAALKRQADAFYAVRNIEAAIRDLGYVVLDGSRTVGKNASRLDGHEVNRARALDAARARVAGAEPGDSEPGGSR